LTWQIYQGNALEKLKQLESESVHCCVTSPPYWALRDYGVEDQIGQEETPEEYVDKLVHVFREVKRVLRDDGTLWLNIGDTYCGTGNKGGYRDPKYKEGRTGQVVALNNKIDGLKPKDLVGIPWMLAFALRADGWWLRSDIIWAKGNPMPESVTDRPTKAHEYIFLLSKSERYFYDAEAIKENSVDPQGSAARYKYTFSGRDGLIMPDGKPQQIATKGIREFSSKRNKRTVWNITTKPFSEAHFATFPPEIPETCIKAGTSEKGCCPKCGSPWIRVIEKTGHINKREPAHVPNNCPTKTDNTGWAPTTRATDKWQPICSCGIEETTSCTVLDPFAGAGTTLWVAEQLGINSIGIEINPEYCEIIRRRMGGLEMNLFQIQ